jgi:predicted ribosomally synthesized peptide with nif11-like leader
MAYQSDPLEFLKTAQKDPKLNARVRAAAENGGKTTAKEVLKIAQEAGYSFTGEEFETAVRADMARRFAAGDVTLRRMVNDAEPLSSSCAKGCLSWSISYCP